MLLGVEVCLVDIPMTALRTIYWRFGEKCCEIIINIINMIKSYSTVVEYARRARCINRTASRQSFPNEILRLEVGGGLLKTRHLACPPQNHGGITVVPVPKSVEDKNHSTNSAGFPSCHILYNIFYGYCGSYFNRVTSCSVQV